MRFPKHIAGLDGVRAIAVGGVIAFHLGFRGPASIGWSGVQLFFVLSGFLITNILLEDKGSPHYYSRFYSRRSLRIFPIYFLTIGALAVVGAVAGQNVSDWPYYATYTQGWLFLFRDYGEYFLLTAGHTWTLAIEEQFYLLWPLAVALLRERALLKLVVLIIVLGNLSRWLMLAVVGDWQAVYGPLFCQMDMLAWGALGAIAYSRNLLPEEKIFGLAKLVALIGLAILAVAWLHYGSGFIAIENLASPQGNVLFGTFGPFYLSLIILAMSLRPLTNFLELRPIRYCGKISYGLYLYHWPLLAATYAWLGTTVLTSSGVIVSVIATLLTAAASYHFIERPILLYKEQIAPRVAGPSLRPVTAPAPEPVAALPRTGSGSTPLQPMG